MNVLYLTANALDEGVSRSQVLPYVERLGAAGRRLTLAVWTPSGTGPAATESAWGRIVHVPRRGGRGLLRTARDLRAATRACRDRARADRVELVHARGFLPALVARRLSRLLDVPWVFDVRGKWADQRADDGRIRPDGLLHRRAARMERRLIREAPGAIVLTHAYRRELLEAGVVEPARACVVPCCVDLDRFAPEPRRPATGRVRLLHAGSIGGRYDLETTLRFSDAVGRAAGDASLTVLTRSPSAREALARLAPAASRPTLDAADFDAVPARIAEHDVGLCLLRPARANVASCPTKLPEFLASGRPVVTTPGVGDWEAFLRAWGVGVLVRGPDESSLGEAARALCRLLEDPGLAARCRRAAEVAFDLEEGAGAVALAHDAAVA